ncbi:hypothetical protein CDD83_6877 [Cordyceps sp. RAO-2017]|nr:hypothetical protein CDD83_6877 [Cordyceps sp. RAO-2017]
MALPRESTFLPTIKCSLCGNQVEISMMGDHLCGGPTVELSPPPEPKDRFDDYGWPSHGRTPPPVDTDAANRPFINKGQLTPVSQPSASRTGSPAASAGRYSPGSPHSPARAQRPGGYGGFGGRSKREPDEPDPVKSGGGVLDRMNALVRGPFDAPARPSTSRSSGRSAFPNRKDSLEMWDGPATGRSNGSGGGGGWTITIAPPKAPRKNGYGGFGPPGSASSDHPEPGTPGFISRSETYPKPSAPVESHRRMPSAPGSGGRPDPSPTNSQYGDGRLRASGPDRTRRPPPRTSLLGQRAGRDSGSVDVAAEFGVGNPYHASIDSASSGYSGFSDVSRSTAATTTSPARSQTYRDREDADDAWMSSTGKARPRDLRVDTAARAPPRRDASPTTDGLSPRAYAASPQDMRFDPAVQTGRADAGRQKSYDVPRMLPAPFSSSRRSDRGDDGGSRTASPAAAGRRGGAPNAAPSRGDCKACRLPIRGKSISSADGRLTGKYHKACFVCATCAEPFTSAEFYVLGDRPYCEQHYHRLNGSLCGTCGRGIEGQYLEDEARTKYHVGCFRCLDCGRSLSDGYFEVDGGAYCEPDAWRRTQPPPSQPQQPPQPGRRPSAAVGGLPGRPVPRSGSGSAAAASGLPPRGGGASPGSRLGPGIGLPRPQMNKRMTRLGRM